MVSRSLVTVNRAWLKSILRRKGDCEEEGVCDILMGSGKSGESDGTRQGSSFNPQGREAAPKPRADQLCPKTIRTRTDITPQAGHEATRSHSGRHTTLSDAKTMYFAKATKQAKRPL
jgi:hypothetical protein